MIGVSLSSAARAHECPGSVILPKTRNNGGARGSAGHEYVSLLVTRGRAIANADFGEIVRRFDIDDREAAFLRSLVNRFEPPIPHGALSETALCLCENGSVIQVDGGKGVYDEPSGAIISGSLDLMWSEPEKLQLSGDSVRCPSGSVLWVVDFKFGNDSNLARADRNRQILWAAVLAAKWTGAERVMPALCFVESESMPAGRWDMRRQPGAWPGAPSRPRPYDRAELAVIEAELRAGHRAWVEQARRADAGKPLDLVTGAHCEHCPAKGACPAWVAPVRALVADAPGRLAMGALTGDEASRLATVLPVAKRALEAADAALRAYVAEHGPVSLPDGRVFGPQIQSWVDQGFATRATYQILADEIGAAEADAAFSATKTSIEEAIRRAHEKKGIARQVQSTMGRVMAKLKEAGAITETPVVHMKAHHPIDKE